MLTFFQAHKRFDQQMLDNEPITGAIKETSLFRFLLSHTWWSGENYGWVTPDWTAQARIARVMGMSVVTVQRTLTSLEDEGFIKRHSQYGGRGVGRLPDQIEIVWLEKFNQATSASTTA